ncbi:MAG: hypothetical protein ABIH41_06770 [Nanoarchaeota archaeon]
MVDNGPMIEAGRLAMLQMASVDATIEWHGSGSSDGVYEFDMGSARLDAAYPELFFGAFCRTAYRRVDDGYVVAQGFRIGHTWSDRPDKVPGFITKSVEKRGGMTKSQVEVGLVPRDIEEASIRGLLSVRGICDLAQETYIGMRPGAVLATVDYNAMYDGIFHRAQMRGSMPHDTPETVLMARHLRDDVREDSYVHFFSNGGRFHGSGLLVACRSGGLDDLDVVSPLQSFYDSLRVALGKRYLPDPLA